MSEWNDGPPPRFARGMEIITRYGAFLVVDPSDDGHSCYNLSYGRYFLAEVTAWRWPGAGREWTPVEVALPAVNEHVLVSGSTAKRPTVGFRRAGNDSWTTFGTVGRVTAWMPLPEPYRGES